MEVTHLSSHQELIEAALLAGREGSTAGVLMHTAIAAQVGLSPTDEKTLDILLRLGPLTAGQIAEHTGLATASVTTLIDRLETKGFVERVRDTKDRRRVIVHAKPERLADFGPYFESFLKQLTELLEGYSDEHLVVVTDFLNRVAELSRSEAIRLNQGNRTEATS